ncbi:MAG: penicillin acylase family protein, partial [Myxococcota bacterium]|nr:penicillin acylase family protein [Myxococcota bacterium]
MSRTSSRGPWAFAVALLWVGCGGGAPGSVGDDLGSNVVVDAQGDAVASDVTGSGDAVSDAGAIDRARDREALLSVQETGRRALDGLDGEVHVLRTEMGVPHLYASHREDLLRVYGFVMAQDRFFMMDLARRMGTGRLTELLGDAALSNDMETRGTGMAYVTDRLMAHMGEAHGRLADAFAAGINAYIEGVESGALAAPSELALAAPLLGAASPAELMTPFERRDVAAMFVVVLYESSFETGDVGRAHGLASMESHYEGVALQALRRQGAWQDIHADVAPIKPIASAPGFGTNGTWEAGLATAAGALTSSTVSRVAAVPPALLERLAHKLDGYQRRLLRDHDAGFGSNAWAVSGAHGEGGAAVLAGDGHLQLSVPSILYQIGLDTSVLGGGDLHQLGLTIPGLPMMPIGTNGSVAWSQTQFGGDITDWYAEEITLDEEGRPTSSRVGEAWHPLTRVEEVYEIADVPVLGSVGRTLEASR